MLTRALIVCIAVVSAASASAFVYQYDDGVSDTPLTTSGPPTFNVIFLTQYTVAAGGEVLNSIDVVWGSRHQPNLPNGLSANVLLMSDPNGDGNPNDAAVLQSIAATTTNVGTDTFNNYALTPANMAPGTSFFAGAMIFNVPTGSAWVTLDDDAIGRSANNWWNVVISSPVGTHNPMTLFGPNYTAMVRVNASPVPEPASILALASGVSVLLRRRRR
jgi:hypothetical protein